MYLRRKTYQTDSNIKIMFELVQSLCMEILVLKFSEQIDQNLTGTIGVNL